MKTMKTKLLVMLWVMLIPVMTTNCNAKKNTEKSETAEETAKTESVIQLSLPPFQKFVVVTSPEEGLYKNADTNSPTLVRWDEADCERTFARLSTNGLTSPTCKGSS
jgi:hypothetical protein